MKRYIALSIFGILLSSGAFADAKGDEVAHKYFDLKSPADTTAVATMTITDRTGIVKTRKLKMIMKDSPEGKKSYTEFVEPADVNGTKFLTISHKGAENDQRLYLPALKKIRKISSSSKDGEFVGSDFYYFDMEQRYFEDASYNFLSENETLPDPVYAGMKFWKIAMTFKNNNAPYSKSIVWINMNDLVAYKAECYDKKDGAILKTILINKVEIIKDYTIPVSTVVINHKKGSQTQMSMSNILIETGIKDSDFSVKRLEQ